MINRKKLKEILESEVKKQGSIRAAAAKIDINPTSLTNYIDMVTEPTGKMIKKIAAHFRIAEASLLDNESESYTVQIPTASIELTPQQPLVIREPQPAPPGENVDLIGKAGIVLSSKTIYGEALKQNIEAFYQAVKENWRSETNGGIPPVIPKNAAENGG